jgi:hypothetical protein
MTALALALAWVLSTGLFVLEGAGAYAAPGASRLGLMLLPWLVACGLPRRRSEPSWLLALGLATPGLALAVALDVPRESLATTGFAYLAASLAACGLLAFGAARVSGRARLGVAWECLWLALLPLPAALYAALAWMALPGDAEPSSVVRGLAALDPLVGAWRIARDGLQVPGAAARIAGLLGAPALLAAVALWPRARSAA